MLKAPLNPNEPTNLDPPLDSWEKKYCFLCDASAVPVYVLRQKCEDRHVHCRSCIRPIWLLNSAISDNLWWSLRLFHLLQTFYNAISLSSSSILLLPLCVIAVNIPYAFLCHVLLCQVLTYCISFNVWVPQILQISPLVKTFIFNVNTFFLYILTSFQFHYSLDALFVSKLCLKKVHLLFFWADFNNFWYTEFWRNLTCFWGCPFSNYSIQT